MLKGLRNAVFVFIFNANYFFIYYLEVNKIFF